MNHEMKKIIKGLVMQKLDPTAESDDADVRQAVDMAIAEYSGTYAISARDKIKLANELFNDIKRLDILQELLEDDSVTEIMVNGFNNIFYERQGQIYRWEKQFESQNVLNDIVQRIAAASNKIVNEAVPIADTKLADGSRVNIVMSPIAIGGPTVTIRKFYNKPLSMEKLIDMGSLSEEAAMFLQKLVISKYNIFVSGGTGSGKTTFLNVLSNYIPKEERIITIEDSAELQLSNVDNLVRLEARNANIEGRNAISIRDLIKSSLRMRPDRIIVGEVRGSEAIDMLQAMNTGHDGSMSTGHANGPEDMLLRLETMVLMGMDIPIGAVRSQIASALDIVVHLGRLRDGSRHVMSISEVCGIVNGEVKLMKLYEFVEKGVDCNGKINGKLEATGNIFQNREKLQRAGFTV